jgi:hypothetical protein
MTKHDHKNFGLILQLGNVQKNQYIIMNIVQKLLSTIPRKWKNKLFHETNSDLLSTCMVLPTARYTESDVIEAMNYILYV